MDGAAELSGLPKVLLLVLVVPAVALVAVGIGVYRIFTQPWYPWDDAGDPYRPNRLFVEDGELYGCKPTWESFDVRRWSGDGFLAVAAAETPGLEDGCTTDPVAWRPDLEAPLLWRVSGGRLQHRATPDGAWTDAVIEVDDGDEPMLVRRGPDGQVVVTSCDAGVIGAYVGCSVQVSADGGATWNQIPRDDVEVDRITLTGVLLVEESPRNPATGYFYHRFDGEELAAIDDPAPDGELHVLVDRIVILSWIDDEIRLVQYPFP